MTSLLGCQGFTAVASSRILLSGSGSTGFYSGAASLVGEDVTYVDSFSGVAFTGATTGSAAISGGVTGVITSQAAARQFIASQLTAMLVMTQSLSATSCPQSLLRLSEVELVMT